MDRKQSPASDFLARVIEGVKDPARKRAIHKHQTEAGRPGDPKAPGDPDGFGDGEGAHKEPGGGPELPTQKPHGRRVGAGGPGGKRRLMALLNAAMKAGDGSIPSWTEMEGMDHEDIRALADEKFSNVDEMLAAMPKGKGGKPVGPDDVPEGLVERYMRRAANVDASPEPEEGGEAPRPKRRSRQEREELEREREEIERDHERLQVEDAEKDPRNRQAETEQEELEREHAEHIQREAERFDEEEEVEAPKLSSDMFATADDPRWQEHMEGVEGFAERRKRAKVLTDNLRLVLEVLRDEYGFKNVPDKRPGWGSGNRMPQNDEEMDFSEAVLDDLAEELLGFNDLENRNTNKIDLPDGSSVNLMDLVRAMPLDGSASKQDVNRKALDALLARKKKFDEAKEERRKRTIRSNNASEGWQDGIGAADPDFLDRELDELLKIWPLEKLKNMSSEEWAQLEREIYKKFYNPSGEPKETSLTQDEYARGVMDRAAYYTDGYWMRFSGEAGDLDIGAKEADKVQRFYFNLRPDAAADFVGKLKEALDAEGLKYQYKMPLHLENFDRSDTAVLYIDGDDFEVVSIALKKIYDENSDYFDAEVPRFAKKIAPGVATADEPSKTVLSEAGISSASFGTAQASLIRNALRELSDSGGFDDLTTEDVKDHIKDVYKEVGLDPDRPWLNRAGIDTEDGPETTSPEPLPENNVDPEGPGEWNEDGTELNTGNRVITPFAASPADVPIEDSGHSSNIGGYRPEKGNQDAAIAGHTVNGVADGVGGMSGGHQASAAAARSILAQEGTFHLGSENIAEFMVRTALNNARNAVARNAPGGATTASFHVLRPDGVAIFAHVGDSQAYYVTPDGEVIKMTAEQGGKAWGVRSNVVVNTLGGSHRLTDDEVFSFQTEPGSYIIHTTDGVGDYLSEKKLEEIIREGKELGLSAQQIADRITTAALTDNDLKTHRNGSHDNVTASVTKIGKPSEEAPGEASSESFNEEDIAFAGDPEYLKVDVDVDVDEHWTDGYYRGESRDLVGPQLIALVDGQVAGYLHLRPVHYENLEIYEDEMDIDLDDPNWEYEVTLEPQQIFVEREFRRKGIATELWRQAKEQFDVQHSPNRTPDGRKWSAAVDERFASYGGSNACSLGDVRKAGEGSCGRSVHDALGPLGVPEIPIKPSFSSEAVASDRFEYDRAEEVRDNQSPNKPLKGYRFYGRLSGLKADKEVEVDGRKKTVNYDESLVEVSDSGQVSGLSGTGYTVLDYYATDSLFQVFEEGSGLVDPLDYHHRGMSYEELENLLETGKLGSLGQGNTEEQRAILGDVTYVSEDIDSALDYAKGEGATSASYDKPGFIVTFEEFSHQDTVPEPGAMSGAYAIKNGTEVKIKNIIEVRPVAASQVMGSVRLPKGGEDYGEAFINHRARTLDATYAIKTIDIEDSSDEDVTDSGVAPIGDWEEQVEAVQGVNVLHDLPWIARIGTIEKPVLERWAKVSQASQAVGKALSDRLQNDVDNGLYRFSDDTANLLNKFIEELIKTREVGQTADVPAKRNRMVGSREALKELYSQLQGSAKYGALSDNTRTLLEAAAEKLLPEIEDISKEVDAENPDRLENRMYNSILSAAKAHDRLEKSNRDVNSAALERRSSSEKSMSGDPGIERGQSVGGGISGDMVLKTVYDGNGTPQVSYIVKTGWAQAGVSEYVAGEISKLFGIEHLLPAYSIEEASTRADADAKDLSSRQSQAYDPNSFDAEADRHFDAENSYTLVEMLDGEAISSAARKVDADARFAAIAQTQYYKSLGLSNSEAARRALVDVQTMAMFDAILFNPDRSGNAGNTLYSENGGFHTIDFAQIFMAWGMEEILIESVDSSGNFDESRARELVREIVLGNNANVVPEDFFVGFKGVNPSELLPEVLELLAGVHANASMIESIIRGFAPTSPDGKALDPGFVGNLHTVVAYEGLVTAVIEAAVEALVELNSR